jgi:D-threo-aldose 1-dehydrogenase
MAVRNPLQEARGMKTRRFQAPSGAAIDFTELGFGSAPLGNLFHAISEEQAQTTLQAAWAAGVRYFDTAPLYGLGLAETRLNHFLRGRDRDSYVLSTKVGRLLEVCPPDERTGIGKFFDTPSRRERYDYGYDGIMRSLDYSLERLGIDRVDIVFVHDLDRFNHGSQEAVDARFDELMASGYRALVKLRDEGVVRAIGAGVNEWQICQRFAEAGDFDLFLLAGRYTLLEQESLETFLPLCEKRGIGIVIGGAYNSGILASGARKGAVYNYSPAPPEILERVSRIEAVCARHDVRLVQAALRFPLVHPAVACVIPGASRPEEVALNMETLAARLPPALWADLKAEGLLRADAPVPG